MKGIRLKIFFLSILLLTISSGLLFFRNIYLNEPNDKNVQVNFEELKNTDLQINAIVATLRMNPTSDLTPLEDKIIRLKELINIITDVNKNTSEIKIAIEKIRTYFDKKILDLSQFQIGIKELKNSIGSLRSAQNELRKNNIKFSVDNKDFYQETLIDSLFFIASATKENEARLAEDKKILAQILTFAKSPNPIIQNFSNHINVILKQTKEMSTFIDDINNEKIINNDLVIVSKYYSESEEQKLHDSEMFLTIVFGALFLYLISVIVILKK